MPKVREVKSFKVESMIVYMYSSFSLAVSKNHYSRIPLIIGELVSNRQFADRFRILKIKIH